MRVEYLQGYYDPGGHACSFFGLRGNFIGEFPLTYTPQECVEDWCILVGWRLIYMKKRPGSNLYWLRFWVGSDENITDTIRTKRVVCV